MSYGVFSFEHVWERMIDYIFGEDNKEEYFPHGRYSIIKDGQVIKSSALEPDTIMKKGDNIFIVDAKYYKYGVLSNPNNLPPTSSIHKQITYGEYAFLNKGDTCGDIYNAFVIPYASQSIETFSFVGVGMGDWIAYNSLTPSHRYVLVILMDTKHVIETCVRHSIKDIELLADYIVDSLKTFRDGM